MSSFDPITVRKAVEEFTSSRPQRFRELTPAKEVIIELRQKRASYQAIADLLTKHCLPVSKTSVAAFCHEVLKEIVRPRKRSNRKRSARARGYEADVQKPLPEPPQPTKPQESPAATDIPRSRGPRIAQVRIARNS